MKTDTVRLTKMRETIQRKLRNVEEQKVDTESQKETLKSQIVALERGKIEELFYFLFLCVCVCVRNHLTSQGCCYNQFWLLTNCHHEHVATYSWA